MSMPIAYVTETHQLDFDIFSLLMYLCKRNSLAGLVIFFRFVKNKFTFVHFAAFSQLRTCRPPPLSTQFSPVLMKDAECAKSNKKSIFLFLFFELSLKFIENWGDFQYKNDLNSKNKNLKNLKFDFSFDSANSASFMSL